jgi:hypothetical protein
MCAVAVCAALLVNTSASAAAGPTVSAASAKAPVKALSRAEMADLKLREEHAGPLVDFRGGDAELATDIAAWTGAGFGVPAFILALIAL